MRKNELTALELHGGNAVPQTLRYDAGAILFLEWKAGWNHG
jgi:hypothetical protein